jgi:hypothetical protein
MLTENQKVEKSREHRPVNEKRSKNGPKKTSVLFLKIARPHMLSKLGKHEKSADARFFRSIYSFFFTFQNEKKSKKMEKYPKNHIFSSFSLCSAPLFPKHSHYTKC